jgi:CheY-like chemotaxis protein
LNATADEFGWTPRPDEDRPSFSNFQACSEPQQESELTVPSILLVEDNSADVSLVEEALAEHHVRHALTVIRDGEKAIDYIDAVDLGNSTCPNLVILDLNLPRRSGQDVLRRMRLSTHCGDVPVIILSSSGAPKDRDEAKSLGATLYIKKPNDLAEYLSIGGTIKNLLAK